MAYRATSLYGPGVSSDGVYYLSTADQFAQHGAFFDYKGDPLVDFPPLYPLLLGLASWLSGKSPFVWGWAVNIASMGLLVISAAWLFKRALPENALWTYLGTAATGLFLAFQTLAANIATDLIFILLLVWFCLAAQNYLSKKSIVWLGVLTAIAAAESMLRWIGLAFVLAEVILILIANRRQLRQGILHSLVFGGLAVLPFLLWTIGRNYLDYGTMMGGRASNPVSTLENLRLSAEKIRYWFLPENGQVQIGILILVVLLIIFVLVINHKQDWLRWLDRLRDYRILPVLVVTLAYFAAMVVTAFPWDHYEILDDRYQAPLFFAMLIIFFSGCEELIFSHFSNGRLRAVQGLVTLLFVGWLGFSAARTAGFVQASKELGVTVYNLYNTKKMVRSGFVEALKNTKFDQSLPIYSNEPEAVYFFTRLRVGHSPFDPDNLQASIEDLKMAYPSWPPEPKAYLVWFKPNPMRNHLPLEDIKAITLLDPLYKQWDGEILLVSPKNE